MPEEDKQKLAAELLNLELREDKLRISEEERWLELVAILFGDTPHRRAGVRFPTNVAAAVLVNGERVPCRVVNFSRAGVALAFEPTYDLRCDVELELTEVSVAGGTAARSVKYKIVRLSKSEDSTSTLAALEVVPSNSPLSRQQFDNRAYRPLYLRHLERLKSGED